MDLRHCARTAGSGDLFRIVSLRLANGLATAGRRLIPDGSRSSGVPRAMPPLGQRTRCREGRSVDADSGGREIDRRRGPRVVLGDQRMVQHDRSHCAAGDSTADLLHGGRHVPNRVHAWHGDLLGGLESLPAGTLTGGGRRTRHRGGSSTTLPFLCLLDCSPGTATEGSFPDPGRHR